MRLAIRVRELSVNIMGKAPRLAASSSGLCMSDTSTWTRANDVIRKVQYTGSDGIERADMFIEVFI